MSVLEKIMVSSIDIFIRQNKNRVMNYCSFCENISSTKCEAKVILTVFVIKSSCLQMYSEAPFYSSILKADNQESDLMTSFFYC